MDIDFINHIREELKKTNKRRDELMAAESLYNSFYSNNHTIENGSQIGGSDSSMNDKPKDFSKFKGHTLKDTVFNIVTSKGEDVKSFKPIRDIFDIAIEIYPEKKEIKEKFRGQISGILSTYRAEGIIAKYQFSSSKKDALWGANELIVDGTPVTGSLPEGVPYINNKTL